MSNTAAQPFVYTHRVTYRDCTVGNHVYYARYLDLLEGARGELLRAAGCPLGQLQEQGLIFPVIEARLRYKGPARYDEDLRIEVFVTCAERVRLNFGYRVLHAGTGALLVEGETAHVCTDLHDKPKRLPPELADRLRPYRLTGG